MKELHVSFFHSFFLLLQCCLQLLILTRHPAENKELLCFVLSLAEYDRNKLVGNKNTVITTLCALSVLFILIALRPEMKINTSVTSDFHLESEKSTELPTVKATDDSLHFSIFK